MQILIWVVVTLAKFKQKSQNLNQKKKKKKKKLGRKKADFWAKSAKKQY